AQLWLARAGASDREGTDDRGAQARPCHAHHARSRSADYILYRRRRPDPDRARRQARVSCEQARAGGGRARAWATQRAVPARLPGPGRQRSLRALSRLAFQVAPGSDLAELGRELAKHGVKSERRSCISPGVAEAIVFKDPKDTLIEIFCDYVFAKEDCSQLGIMPLKLGHVAYRV